MKTNQSTIISDKIEEFIAKGMTDKQEIYTKVVDELGVPRPTVRRVARTLRDELARKAAILAPNSLDLAKQRQVWWITTC